MNALLTSWLNFKKTKGAQETENPAVFMNDLHWSDCAVNNAPALSPGECDCGAPKADSKYVASLYRRVCIVAVHLGTNLRTLSVRAYRKLKISANQDETVQNRKARKPDMHGEFRSDRQ